MAESGCLRDVQVQNLEVAGNITSNGVGRIRRLKTYENGDAALTLTEEKHAGSVIMQTDVGADRIITIPDPSAPGVTYRFLGQGSGSDADAHDVILKLATATNGFDGMITHLDTDADNVGVWANGGTHDTLQINVPMGFDITIIAKSTTVFYITGTVTSATVPAFSSS